MKLYELAQQYNALLEMSESIDDITLKDTLDSIQEEIDDKAENIAKLIRSLQADTEVIKLEEKRLAERRKAIENRIENIKSYLQNELETAGIDKVKRPTLTVSIANNPPSVLVEDESLIPSEYMVPQPDKIDKRMLLSVLKEGEEIPGCSIQQTKGVRIK